MKLFFYLIDEILNIFLNLSRGLKSTKNSCKMQRFFSFKQISYLIICDGQEKPELLTSRVSYLPIPTVPKPPLLTDQSQSHSTLHPTQYRIYPGMFSVKECGVREREKYRRKDRQKERKFVWGNLQRYSPATIVKEGVVSS